MSIKLGHSGCGSEVPLSFKRILKEFNYGRRHKVHLVWNPTSRLIRGRIPTGIGYKPPIYEPRWDVWIEWEESNHPTRDRLRAGSSRKPDVRTIAPYVDAVRLCAYEWDNGSYADPFNENFFRALAYSDAWRRGFQHSGPDAQVLEGEVTYDAKERELHKVASQIAVGTTEYYRSLDSPIVSPYNAGNTKADWRHRLVHR